MDDPLVDAIQTAWERFGAIIRTADHVLMGEHFSMSEDTVDIAVATFKRPHLLRGLLESLARLRVDSSVLYRVIVVDNDAAGTAQATVSEFLERSSLQLIYDIEPQQNIALARNRALTHATANYVAFVDDDEYVEETWLQSLLDCARHFEADAVFGPVVGVFEQGAPKWIVSGQFFVRPRHVSGTPVREGFTGNALIRFRGSSYQHLRFNQKFGLTGGSDLEFFAQMYKQGGKLVWSDEAIVYELVPPHRTTVMWLVRRAYRGGQTFARIHVPEMSKFAWVQWLARRVFLLTIASFGLSLWFVRRHWGVTALRKIASSMGQLCWQSKNPFKEYEQPRS